MAPVKKPIEHHAHVKLGEGFATAICGNDILSSALYVSGIAIIFGGIFAPLILLAVAGVLFLYKAVYIEVVEALPVNGGAYNCLLNGTSKTVAAIAGVMTILSYIATAVISAKVGVEYVNSLFEVHSFQLAGMSISPVIAGTIALLGFFALLVITGLKDSAKVAFGIFIFHIFTLVSFVVMGAIYYFNGGESQFAVNLAHTNEIIAFRGGFWQMFYLGFSACLLGVSGFESSANFVEEQKKGVFRKTLRNMLIGVAIFNPLIALIILNTLPLEVIKAAKDFVLSDAAMILGGTWYQYLIVADAFLVLSGAVLTSFVGVSGLVHRMALDSCLPNFLTKMNPKGSFPRIIISFFILCSSILIITRGELLSLAGVYTIAFLGVMTLFAIGNLILKETRTELKRTYSAPIAIVILAFLATFVGIIGNIRIDQANLTFFEMYFLPSLALVLFIVYQDYVMRFVMKITKNILWVHEYIIRNFNDMVEGKFIIFIHTNSRLYEILDYVNRNEVGWNIILVHCEDRENFAKIKEMLPVLKAAGVHPHLNITPVFEPGEFGPKLIDSVSKKYGVRKNRIMIGSIHHFHKFDYDELGGVRIIF
ncbi:APC family permease [Candidatus Woesebacteria bacterium]|nr:APC family permease [Candidatus Woesebacteria bacterium]